MIVSWEPLKNEQPTGTNTVASKHSRWMIRWKAKDGGGTYVTGRAKSVEDQDTKFHIIMHLARHIEKSGRVLLVEQRLK